MRLKTKTSNVKSAFKARAIGCASVLLLLCGANLAVAAGNSVTFGDYPRYGTDVSALHPELQAKMRAFAGGLVGAALAGQSVEVTVIGHADFDAKGRLFELEVSRDRALGAESALQTFFSQAADAVMLPVERRKLVRFLAVGVGTQRPIHSPPANELERRANRRVELVFTTAAAPPTDPQEKFRNCIRVLANASAPGPARRMTCVCNKLLQPPPPFVGDYFYNYRAALNARAGAGNMADFTREQMSALYREFMLSVRQEIGKVSGSDADVTAGLLALDDSIGASLTNFIEQAELGAGLFERSVSLDIVKRMQDPHHTYSCFAGYSRRDPNR